MPILDKPAVLSADLLQKRIEEKTAEVGGKLSALKRDLTRNPVAEIAERKPLTILGTVVVAGLLGVLVVRGAGDKGRKKREQKEIVAEVVKQLQTRGDGRELGEREIARIAAATEQVAARPPRSPRPSQIGAYLEAFITPIAKMVARELFSTVMGLVAAKVSAPTEEARKDKT